MTSSRPSALRQCAVVNISTLMKPLRSVDLTTISLRWAAGTSVTHGEESLDGVVSCGREWAVIVEALGGGCGIDAFGDEFGDVDDSLELVDSRVHLIANSHRRGRLRRSAVDSHVSAGTGRGGAGAGLGDPHSVQPLVDAYRTDTEHSGIHPDAQRVAS